MTCDLCGKDKDDAMKRMSPKGMQIREWKNLDIDPVLCRECCSTYPGHEWMAKAKG